MGLSLVQSRALMGLAAPVVTVEVHLANGLPSFTLVGLAETEVKEARERVRSAILNSGLTFPHNQRITVNLAPADLPRTRAGSTCRSRSASWPPAGRSTARAWPAGSSRASCRCRANCARCVARWR